MWSWAADYPDGQNFLVYAPGRTVGKRAGWLPEASPEAAGAGPDRGRRRDRAGSDEERRPLPEARRAAGPGRALRAALPARGALRLPLQRAGRDVQQRVGRGLLDGEQVAGSRADELPAVRRPPASPAGADARRHHPPDLPPVARRPRRPGHREPGGAGRGRPRGRGRVPARVGARPLAPRAVRRSTSGTWRAATSACRSRPASRSGSTSARRFPATIELAVVAMSLSVLIGIPLGMLSAVKRDRLVDQLTRVVSLVGVSMPIFWLGLVALLVFYARLGWAPPPGRLSATLTAPPMVTGFLLIDSLLAGRPAVRARCPPPPGPAGRRSLDLQPRHPGPPDAGQPRSTFSARTTSGRRGPRGSPRER